jgi:hypothetical protein
MQDEQNKLKIGRRMSRIDCKRNRIGRRTRRQMQEMPIRLQGEQNRQ